LLHRTGSIMLLVTETLDVGGDTLGLPLDCVDAGESPRVKPMTGPSALSSSSMLPSGY
jgi:hypothetical protein